MRPLRTLPTAWVAAARLHRLVRPARPRIAGPPRARGVRCVDLDMQHGLIDLAAVHARDPADRAAGKPALVRIPVGEFQTASQLLDAGARRHRADDQHGGGCAPLRRLHEIPAARASAAGGRMAALAAVGPRSRRTISREANGFTFASP